MDTAQHVPMVCCQQMKQNREMFTGYREKSGQVCWTLWLTGSVRAESILEGVGYCPWCAKELRPEEYRQCAFPNCPRDPTFAVKSKHDAQYCCNRCAASDGARRRRAEARLIRPAIATAIRSLRATMGLTQAELAQRLGVALPTVGKYETTHRPSRRMLKLLAALAKEYDLPKASALFSEAINESHHNL